MLGIVLARVFKGVVCLVEASHVADDHDEAVASCLRPIQHSSDESVSNDKFYDAKDLLEDSEDEDNDLSLTTAKTPGPAAQRKDALPPAYTVAVRKPGRDGFDREEVTRTTGGSVGRVDVYYYGPDDKRLRSRKEVKDYCTANGLSYEILDFDFSSNWPVTSTLLDDPIDVG
uniref:MBD domain-containing protein n=1 Tax=Strigamia maritima TaxID=126957 RepID=T1IHH5_STRMM